MSDHRSDGEKSSKLLYCSFCGKSQHEVRKLIAGPQVYICDECVDLCNDIIREEIQGDKGGKGGFNTSYYSPAKWNKLSFMSERFGGSICIVSNLLK